MAKRFTGLCCAVALCLTAAVSGIGSFNKQAKASEVSGLSTFDEFLIGSGISYYDSEVNDYATQTAELAASGLNYSVWTRRMSKMGTYPSMVSDNFGREGMDGWNVIDEIYRENNMYYNIELFTSDENMIVDTMSLTNAISYDLKDEPAAAEIPQLAAQFRKYATFDTTRFPYVNLYPSYAGSKALGGTYTEYVNLWIDEVGAENMEYLSFDHYPFLKTEKIRNTYFSDLEVIRKAAYENGRMKTLGWTLMSEHLGYRKLTPAEARWSCYSLLTYGMKGLTHFNWVSPTYATSGEDYYTSVRNQDGTKTDLFEPMQILNWQMRQLGPIIMNMDVAHAYHTAETPLGAEALPKNYFIAPTKSDDDFIVSIAKSKDDNQTYVLLFNKALEGEATTHSFNIDTTTGIDGLTYFKPTDFTTDTLPDPKDPSTLGTPQEIYTDLAHGVFEDTFLPGEMKIYRVEGDFALPEPVAQPVSSVKEGNYTAGQEITLSNGQTGTEIYYTLDGSYPVPGEGTTVKYNGTFTLGGGTDKIKLYCLRAVAKKGEEVSLPKEYYYFFDTTADTGDELIGTPSADWTENGGTNNWSVEADNISMTGQYSASQSNRGLTYNAKKYGNMIVEMTYTLNSAGGAHPGIGLFKQSATSSIWQNDGYYSILEHAGRVGVYDGLCEYGPINIAAINFDPATENTLKVIVYNNFLSMSVNGVSCYTILDERLVREEGYIAILAAQVPITVSGFKVKALGSGVEHGIAAHPVTALDIQIDDDTVKALQYTTLDKVEDTLPTSISFFDTVKNTVNVEVTKWVCEGFDRKITGDYIFTADEFSLPAGVVNALKIEPKVRVSVVPKEDKSALLGTLEIARALNASEFTSESWDAFTVYLENAEDIYADPFGEINAIAIAENRLTVALNTILVSNKDKTELAELIDVCSEFNVDEYTAATGSVLNKKLAAAREVFAKNYATYAELESAFENLNTARDGLIKISGSDVTQLRAQLSAIIGEIKTLNSELYTEGSFARVSAAVESAESLLAGGTSSFSALTQAKASLDAAKAGLITVADTKPQAAAEITNNAPTFSGGQIVLLVFGCLLFIGALAFATFTLIKKFRYIPKRGH